MLITFKHRYNNITGFIQKVFIILSNVNIMSEKVVLLNLFPCVYIITQNMKENKEQQNVMTLTKFNPKIEIK